MAIIKIFTEPIVHFLMIGAVLFIVFEFTQSPTTESGNTIVITASDIAMLRANFDRTWKREPSDEEFEYLLEEKIRDEIAYSEALALGLDRDDAYIRRRLRVKLELMLEEMSEAEPIKDQELHNFLKQNSKLFYKEPQIGFSQIYLNPDTRGEKLLEDGKSILQKLNSAPGEAQVENLGDPIMLPARVAISSISKIKKQFGDNFTDGLTPLKPGKWQGPILSGFGYHLVLVHDYSEGRNPELSEVRAEVEREILSQRKNRGKERVYSSLREKYEIVVEQNTNG